MLVLSWVAALVACVCYGSASVLQSVGAKRVAGATGAGGVALIVTQGPYLLGLGADAVAFVGNVVALQRLPLFLVQSILAGSVGVTALIATLRGQRLTRRDWVLLGVLGAGLVLVSATAAVESAVAISAGAAWVIFGSSLLTVVVGLVGLRLRGRGRWVTFAAAAGLGFSGVAIASRGISADAVDWSLLASPLAWTIAVQGVLALGCFALALQCGPVTTITAVTFVIEMVIPGGVGLLIFGDTVRPGWGGATALGFALAVVGTVGLARYAE